MNQVIVIYLCKITIPIHQLKPKEASKKFPCANQVSNVKLTYEDGKLRMKHKHIIIIIT